MDPILADDELEELHLFLVELALALFEASLLEEFHYLLYVSFVFFEVIRVDKKVVQVNHKELVQEFMESVLHVVLKGTECIA